MQNAESGRPNFRMAATSSFSSAVPFSHISFCEVSSDRASRVSSVSLFVDTKLTDPHLLKDAIDDTRYLRLCEIAQFVSINYVDIALIKFSKPSFSCLRRFATPNFLNLVSTEWKRQFPLSHRDITRKGHCEIEMQCPFRRSLVIGSSS